ncbi:glycogen debranching protein GlgX [Frigidibacter sp. RF13]|uniref:glycogen debranching protein GlgX n=1 Tax=Frigidibacter sp. RF13 TaxID=2997340 RepID=UPI00226D683B|nr:glycogen debranching protein GlgX [Frigidibacter sp. RF13]MCY1125634.1 glycogen debranching protein GlgX [Frigidibacter sp. RF13]
MTAHASRALTPDFGALAGPGGTQFTLFSANAERIDLCLFENGTERRIPMQRAGHLWQSFVPGIGPGQAYGYRALGPWAPEAGHLFNPAKLLLDPYARALDGRLSWHPAMTGYAGASPFTSGPSHEDSAPHVPKCLVTASPPPAARAPDRPVELVYEAHLKGLTRLHPAPAEALRGTWAGLSDPHMIAHLRSIGVSHVELLPVAAFIDDRHVAERGLPNYWGYQPICHLAPEPRYLGAGQDPRTTIAALKAAEIGVILDVVFNHTGEGDLTGPTIAFRGLDNASYYRLTPGGGYVNDTGCGNTMNLAHPMVAQLCLDALRHWAAMGIAGFRFDLAVTLVRDGASFLDQLRADPILGRLILIVEPWDLGPDGYRLGRFSAPFREWNDRFRDDVRRYWRHDGRQGDLARRLAGSAEIFDAPGRQPEASVNLLSAHDGFTLADLVSFADKHNDANREGNHDGHTHNLSDNLGVEGPTTDPVIAGARARRVRAMLATLFVSQGTPMLLAGDELGRSQNGNNNAYSQDNPISWTNWTGADTALASYVARLAALRRRFGALRQHRFLHGALGPDGRRDLAWYTADGREPTGVDWDARGEWPFGMCLSDTRGRIFVIFNSGGEGHFLLPAGPWQLELDSSAPDRPVTAHTGKIAVAAQSVLLFSQTGPAGK